jgi:hypothetical protein
MLVPDLPSSMRIPKIGWLSSRHSLEEARSERRSARNVHARQVVATQRCAALDCPRASNAPVTRFA